MSQALRSARRPTLRVVIRGHAPQSIFLLRQITTCVTLLLIIIYNKKEAFSRGRVFDGVRRWLYRVARVVVGRSADYGRQNTVAHHYTYQDCLSASERIQWRVEDLIGGDRKLDFSKPFLPESLARVEPLTFLNADEKLKLNQIRANGYLYIFGFVEEFILPFVVDHSRKRPGRRRGPCPRVPGIRGRRSETSTLVPAVSRRIRGRLRFAVRCHRTAK